MATFIDSVIDKYVLSNSPDMPSMPSMLNEKCKNACPHGTGLPWERKGRNATTQIIWLAGISQKASSGRKVGPLCTGCENRAIKKTESQRIDAFELWCWRRLLRVLWTARTSNQSILKEINPEYSLEGLMLKLQDFIHLM